MRKKFIFLNYAEYRGKRFARPLSPTRPDPADSPSVEIGDGLTNRQRWVVAIVWTVFVALLFAGLMWVIYT